jgi:hypothetical protein
MSQQPDPGAAWEQFFSQTLPAKLTETDSDITQVKGFILALRDCCLDQSQDDGIPKDVADRLRRTVELDPRPTAGHRRPTPDQAVQSRPGGTQPEGPTAGRPGTLHLGVAARLAEPNLVGMLVEP